MATQVVKKFVASVNSEGPSQTMRGKIPAGLINQMGGEPGDVIEFELQGRHIVGGRVLKGRNADTARQNAVNQSRSVNKKPTTAKAQTTSKTAKPTAKPVATKKATAKAQPTATKTAKPKAGSKPVAKATPAQTKKPVAKAKSNSRTTKVSYDSAPAKPKAGSNKKKIVRRNK